MELFKLNIISPTNDPNDPFGEYSFLSSDENSYYMNIMKSAYGTEYYTYDMMKNNLLWEIGKTSDELEQKVFGNYIVRIAIKSNGKWILSDYVKFGKFDHFTRVRAYQQAPNLVLFETLMVMDSSRSSRWLESHMKEIFQKPKYKVDDHSGTEVANINHEDLQKELNTIFNDPMFKASNKAYSTYDMPNNMTNIVTFNKLQTPKEAEALINNEELNTELFEL